MFSLFDVEKMIVRLTTDLRDASGSLCFCEPLRVMGNEMFALEDVPDIVPEVSMTGVASSNPSEPLLLEDKGVIAWKGV
jgi:hypothetical protein